MTELDLKWIRVSSILAMIPTKDAEGEWGYPIQNINQDVLQRKADLGTSVHAAIAAHCRGEFMPVNPKEEGYLESYLKWESDTKAQPVEIEKRFYHLTMNLTGCVDMVANFKGTEKIYITDFKCTVSQDAVKWPIQAALYHLLSKENGLNVENTALFVQLDPNGKLPRVYQYTISQALTSAALSWYNAYTYLTNK